MDIMSGGTFAGIDRRHSAGCESGKTINGTGQVLPTPNRLLTKETGVIRSMAILDFIRHQFSRKSYYVVYFEGRQSACLSVRTEEDAKREALAREGMAHDAAGRVLVDYLPSPGSR